jgi:hypothetical protein
MIPSQIWQKIIKEAKVTGIPDRSAFGNVADLPLHKKLTYVVQKHYARRAGPHYDVRLGDTNLHSWATRKGIPSPGEKRLFIHQPIHSKDYAHFEGEIESGYGAGKVSTDDKGSAVITKALPDKINFTLLHKKFPEQFSLIKTNKKHWLALNTTPTDPYKFLGNREAFEKTKMKAVKDVDIKSHLISAKLSGASNLFKLNKDSIDVVSYRISKSGRPIIHTHKFFGLKPRDINIPDEYVGTILRGEVYGLKGEKPISEQKLGGILNASTENSLARQEQDGINLKAAIFDIVGFSGKPNQRRAKIQNILKHLPSDKFLEPPYASSSKEAEKLIHDIRTGKYKLTSEGIVGWPMKGGPPIKSKNFEEADVYVRGFSEGEGRLKGKGIGAIKYSLTSKGKVVGEVASGLADETRSDIHKNPKDYVGRIINIQHRGQGRTGAYFQPSLIAFHDSPRIKQAFWNGFINASKRLELNHI